ncbi:MAG TPA: hypothetical protein TECP_00041 [Hyphomicrobiaceae bacterium MAG_BT-2024]
MSTFGIYVFRQAFSAVILILFALIGIVWIGLVLKQLKLVTSNGQDALVLLSITILAIPKLLAVIAPIALLIAVVHVLNRLNSDSELIVITASRGAIWTVAQPLLFLGFIVSFFLFVTNHAVMPWSLRKLRQQVTEIRTDLLTQVLQPGKFSSPEADVVVHIRSRGLDGTLYGLLMQDNRKPVEITYLAEKARVVKNNKSAFLAMESGHIVRGESGANHRQILRFDNYAIDLERFERKQSTHIWKPQERYFYELLEVDETAQGHGGRYHRGHFVAEFHERLSSVLYPFLFVLIALAYVGQAQSTRQNRNKLTVMVSIIAVAFRAGGLVLNNTVALEPIFIPLMYLLPITGISMSLWLMVINSRPRPGLSMFDRVEILFEDMRGCIKPLLKRVFRFGKINHRVDK